MRQRSGEAVRQCYAISWAANGQVVLYIAVRMVIGRTEGEARAAGEALGRKAGEMVKSRIERDKQSS
jgi:hypothetical protein